MLQPKAKQRLFDKLFNMFGDMSKKELKEFFVDERAVKYFNGIVKTEEQENVLVEEKYCCNSSSIKVDDINSTNLELGIGGACQAIVVEKIPQINADALYFLKEYYNNKKSPVNLNIMQINKLVENCEQPFVFIKLSMYDADVNSVVAQEKLVDIFKKHGIIINIVKCSWDHSFAINNFESKINDNN